MSSKPHPEFAHDAAELQVEIERLLDLAEQGKTNVSGGLRELRSKLVSLSEESNGHLSAMEQVQRARHPGRPFTLDYIDRIFTDWIELHGDRTFRDDPAIVGGWGRLDGTPLMLIGHQKGRSMKENLRRNFGMPHPEGYRKALRLMRLAEKFGRPVVTFIDTPGAYPGVGAEQRGQAEAIAKNLREMARLRIPTVSIVIGEGGSGGALALGLTDRILLLQHSIYSVISPEGCAAILWRSAEERGRAAEALMLTAADLSELGVADEIIPEPAGGAHADWDAQAEALREVLVRHLAELNRLDAGDRVALRFGKYRAIGAWHDPGET